MKQMTNQDDATGGAPKKGLMSRFKGEKKPGGKKKKKKVIIITAVILVVAVFAGFKILGGGGDMALPVGVGAAATQDVREIVSIKGTVEGSERAEVTSSLDFTIQQIRVKEGDHVEKDQILAVLDGKDLQDQVDVARDQYEQAQYDLSETLRQSQKDYDAAVRKLNESKRKYENNKTLYEQGAISREDYITSENAYNDDKAAVDSYTVSGGRVVASSAQSKGLDIKREELSTKAEDLEKIYIKSPISGTVTRVNAKLGRYASDTENKEAMFVVEDLQNLQMNVKVSEFDISKIKVGQTVSITADVLGSGAAEGVVSQISPTGELKDGNSKEMIIPVKIDITGAKEGLIAGVSAKAEILINESKNVMGVPVDALLSDPQTGDNFIYIVEDSKLKKVVVELGVEGDFVAEVKSAELKDGDQVVLTPTLDMTEGMEVMAMPSGGAQ